MASDAFGSYPGRTVRYPRLGSLVRRFSMITTVALIAVMVAACGSGTSSSGHNPTTITASQKASLRAVAAHGMHATEEFQSMVDQCPNDAGYGKCFDQAYHKSGVADAYTAMVEAFKQVQAEVGGDCHAKLETLHTSIEAYQKALDKVHEDITAMDEPKIQTDAVAMLQRSVQMSSALDAAKGPCHLASGSTTTNTGTPVSLHDFADCVTQHGGYAYISSLEPKMQGYPGYQGEVKLSQLAGQYFSAFVFGSPDEATRFADAHGGEFGTDVDVRTSNNVTIAYFKGRDAAAGAVLEACAVHH